MSDPRFWIYWGIAVITVLSILTLGVVIQEWLIHRKARRK